MEVTEHSTCSICKTGVGEMHLIVKKEVEKGTLSERLIPTTGINIYVNIDPVHLPIVGARLPAIRTYNDICENCGVEWAYRVEHGHSTFTGDPRQPFIDFK